MQQHLALPEVKMLTRVLSIVVVDETMDVITEDVHAIIVPLFVEKIVLSLTHKQLETSLIFMSLLKELGSPLIRHNFRNGNKVAHV